MVGFEEKCPHSSPGLPQVSGQPAKLAAQGLAALESQRHSETTVLLHPASLMHSWSSLISVYFGDKLVLCFGFWCFTGCDLGLTIWSPLRPRMPRMPPHFVWWFVVSSRFKAWTKIANIPTAVRTAQVHPNWQVPKSMNIAVGDTWMD